MVVEIEQLYLSIKYKIRSLLSKRRSSVDDVSVVNATASCAAAPEDCREDNLPISKGKYCEFKN